VAILHSHVLLLLWENGLYSHWDRPWLWLWHLTLVAELLHECLNHCLTSLWGYTGLVWLHQSLSQVGYLVDGGPVVPWVLDGGVK